ncbi:uncharacterized protein LOC132553700 [Ylistrum balloti]|uniref:uncharacterized protein LOC132553700 n=1 Tax=Ylistrum balloti TaxID=509963 RepID=UPI00290594B9|nr:uncharacterized protein LOC132553700 [Ylistrum balloti]
MAARAKRSTHLEAWSVMILCVWGSGLIATTTCDDVKHFTATDSCQPPAMEFDIENITKGSWTFTEKSKNCVGSVDGSAGSLSNCTYTMAFCQMLPNCSSGSMCVETFNATGKNDTTKLVQGGYVANPFSVTDTSLNGGFLARFTKGSNYTKSNGTWCQLSADINFECNRMQYWVPYEGRETTSVPQNALKLVKFDKERCQLQVTVEYAGACISITPATAISETLSAGTVLIIIFFVSLAVYFSCGILINLLRGFHGKDLLPQSEFWTQLPVLIADGFLFTCCCKTEEKDGYDSI